MIGKIDDRFECPDDRCGSLAHDIVDEDRGEWRIECAFCGTGQRVRAVRGHLKAEDTFVFRDGRCAGMTVAQAWREPRGQEYVTWAAESHPREAVRLACKKHLDGLQAVG